MQKQLLISSVLGLAIGLGMAFVWNQEQASASADKGIEKTPDVFAAKGERIFLSKESRSNTSLSFADKISRLCNRLLKRMDTKDYENLLDEISSDEDQKYQKLGRRLLIRKWVKVAPRHAVNIMIRREGETDVVFGEWAAHDISSLKEFIEEQGNVDFEKYEGILSNEVIENLAEWSPDYAMEFIKDKNPYDHPIYEDAYAKFLRKVAEVYPERIKDFADQTEGGILADNNNQVGNYPPEIFKIWYEADTLSLEEWQPKSKTVSEEKKEFLEKMKTGWHIREELESSLKKGWLGELRNYTQMELDEMDLSVKERIAYYSLFDLLQPETFEGFNKQIDLHEMYTRMSLDVTAGAFIMEHREEALEFLSEMPKGRSKERFAASLVKMDLSDEHERKLEVLQKIENASERKFYISKYLEKWEKIDKAASDEWKKQQGKR